MSGVLRQALAPVTARSTWRRWSHLILGGALLMPYMMAGQVVAGLLRPGPLADPLYAVQPVIFVAVLPVVALTGLVLPVRALEGTAAKELLGGRIAEVAVGNARSWPERRRTAGWFVLHLGLGGVVSGLTLAFVPFAGWLFTLPFAGDVLGAWTAGKAPDAGLETAWSVPAGVAVLAALVYLAAGSGALLARLAPVLLGPSPAERLATLERRTEQLAERNRLARELHDSVGHSLSVVAVQAGAAERVLDTDPGFARQALTAIQESARSALADLDYVLGLLRDETPLTAPQPTLEDLDQLLDKTRSAGVQVQAEVTGSIERIPRPVSREAYRIVQEGLTNALRHAGKVPVTVRLAVQADRFELEMTNRLGPVRRGQRRGGRGIDGIRERVAALRGDVTAGSDGSNWRVAVSVPLGSAP